MSALPTILIIDDTSFWRETTEQILTKAGYQTVAAGGGAEAFEILLKTAVNLIILDNDMPQMSGLRFLSLLRDDDRWKKTPVIMLTADMRRENIIQAHKLGAAEYLLKAQFSPQLVLTRVEKHMSIPSNYLMTG